MLRRVSKNKMETKKSKKESKGTDWKSLVQGFVGNVLEQLSENVSSKIHAWSKQLKRRAIGGVVMVFGFTYFLTGLSTYADEALGKSVPGLGYMVVGLAALSIGYLVSRK